MNHAQNEFTNNNIIMNTVESNILKYENDLSEHSIYTNVESVLTNFENKCNVTFFNNITELCSMQISTSNCAFIINQEENIEDSIKLLKLRFSSDISVYVVDDNMDVKYSENYILTNSTKILKYKENTLNPKINNQLKELKQTLENLIEKQNQYMNLQYNSDDDTADDTADDTVKEIYKNIVVKPISPKSVSKQNSKPISENSSKEISEYILIKPISPKSVSKQNSKPNPKQISNPTKNQNIKQIEIELDNLLNYPIKPKTIRKNI